MANDEHELSKTPAEPGFVRPHPHEESRSPSQTESEAFAAKSPEEASEPADLESVSAEPNLPGDSDLAPETPESESLEAAVPAALAPELDSKTGRDRAGDPVKQRALFPALAATAIVGALLGTAGSYGLRYLPGAPTSGAIADDRIAALSARLDSLQSKVDASASRSAVAAIESRAAAAESMANKATESVNSALADIQKALAARPASQESGAESTPAQAFDPGPLEARLDGIEQKLAPLEAALAAPKGDVRVQQDRETPVVEHGSQAHSIAIVAQSLLRKLDRGGPYAADLVALEKLGVPPASLEPLRGAAATGVASDRQLATQLAALAPQLIAVSSAKEANEDEGFLDRLTRNAKGLVHVRRVGEMEGNDPRSLVTRIENALADHDIETAYGLWKELPSAAEAKSASWGEAAKARLDAVNAARSIEADAVAVLGKPKP